MPKRARGTVRSRRAGIIGSAVAGAVLLAGGAYAFVQAQGTGGGRAQTTGPLQNVIVVGRTSIPLELDKPERLFGTFINDNSFRVSVGRVKVTITGLNGPGIGPCSFAPNVNFFVTDAVPQAPDRFFSVTGAGVNGSGTGDWDFGSIEFRSSPTINQDGCLNRRVNLLYTALPA